jgi:predicted ATPase/class 3 adenylate cyclase
MTDGDPNRTSTFLFTDIEGSTRRWESVPEMGEQVEAHFEVLRGAVEAGGGRVFATMGDGVAAAFPSAEAAIDAAVAAQLAMPTTGLPVRMGLHTGEADQVGEDFRGRALNRTARIMGVAHGGQVLLSDITATLVRTGPARIPARDLGMHRLRDLEDPEHLWQLEHPDLRSQFPPLRGLDTFANNLPAQRTSLIGRHDEVRAAGKALEDHRVVTLTGAGGVGKTRVALHAAAEAVGSFQGVWFVPLASVSDPADVASAVAVAVGLDATQADNEAALVAALAAPTLLVVDNCEHVVDEAARLVDHLAASCPELRVLATSREPLAIPGEQVVPVEPLDVDTGAAELFRQRVEAAGATLGSGDDALVRTLCERLDGLPLAIELAAARVPGLGLATVVDGLDDRFRLLAAGRRRGTGHHQRMHDTVDWSFRLLAPEEQDLFLHLAVFPAGFEMDAAVHVGGQRGRRERQAVDVVASLAAKNMLVADRTDHGVRYRMLETLRAFAADALDDAGRAASALHLAEWVASLADTPPNQPCSAEVERTSIRLEREAEAWREAAVTATRLGSEDLAGRLCGPPAVYFLLGRHDLAGLLAPLLELCAEGSRRRAVLCALVVSHVGYVESSQLAAWADEIEAIDAEEPTGYAGLARWIALAWENEIEQSVQVTIDASNDERHAQDTRDMFVGIAIVDRFSLTWTAEDVDGLVPRALDVIGRSEVASQRVSCLLGVAWAKRRQEPRYAAALTRRALDEMPLLPAYLRHTLPGNASRLLTGLDAGLATRYVLEEIEQAEGSTTTLVDLIPAMYGALILHRVDHPAAGPALATLSVSPVASYLSYVLHGTVTQVAAQEHQPVPLPEMFASLRSGLEALAATAEALEEPVPLDELGDLVKARLAEVQPAVD